MPPSCPACRPPRGGAACSCQLPRGRLRSGAASRGANRGEVAHGGDLVGVLDREKAQIGVLISLQDPTRPMREEAANAGFYRSPWDSRDYPRVQLLTVAELLDARGIQMPAPSILNTTYQRAQRAAPGGAPPTLPGA